MLVTLNTILDIATSRNAAVGAFNVNSLESLEAVLEAAEAENSPVIIQYAPVHTFITPIEVIGPIMVMMAERASVPVCVHFDHGSDFGEIHKALEIGFTSVMYDGSALPYEQNVANTRAIVELCAQYGASVEAEIGSMGAGEMAAAHSEASYTEPEDAMRFVADTGVDALACSFGTVHGLYTAEPNLDFDRVQKISDLIGIPIVMHGGSGVSAEDFRKCIDRGVRKINYYTYMAKAGGTAVREKLAGIDGVVLYHDFVIWGREAMREDVTKAMRVFAGK